MKRKISFLHLLVRLIAVFGFNSQAQFYLTADVEGYYDDNIFNNYLNESDFINAFSGEIGYDFETEQNNFELYYIGFLNRYYKHTDKSTAIHKFGAVNTYLFSENDNPFNVGINYTIRINKEDYYIYDFNQISAYANYMHSISESNKIQLGVIGNRIDYENFSLFSHYQLKAFLRSINILKVELHLLSVRRLIRNFTLKRCKTRDLQMKFFRLNFIYS